MKTAISLPDDLFILANQFAEKHGLSRSELYATALRTYIHTYQQENLTEQINRACENLDTSLPEEIKHTARRTLLEAEW